jgi:hypothetical protein
MGKPRPTKKTDALIDRLIEWIESGKTLRTFARSEGINASTIYDWRDEDPALAQRLARARERAAESLEDEILEICDTSSQHPDDVQHRKLQVWGREKRLVWNNPARYGSKTQIGGAADLPPVNIMTDEQRLARINEMLEAAKLRRSLSEKEP